MLKQSLITIPVLAGILSLGVFAQNNSKPEPLYSAQFTNEYLIVEVTSNGCTRPEDFTIIARGEAGVDYSAISLVRDKPDRCRAMPHLVSLQLELPGALAALKEPYQLENLFVSKSRMAQ